VSTVAGENPAETQPDATGGPLLAVVRGNPSAEEIAALVAVLTARTGPSSAGEAAARPGSAWSARSRLLREPLPRGPGGWRASALPR
jgi:Acyl-CoA carboxylase epsilon subunit